MSAEEWQRPPKTPFTAVDLADMRAYAERVLDAGDGAEILPMTCGVMFTLDEIERLWKRVAALEELIAGSAPLTWAATGDQDRAQAWEKVAAELLKAGEQ